MTLLWENGVTWRCQYCHTRLEIQSPADRPELEAVAPSCPICRAPWRPILITGTTRRFLAAVRRWSHGW